MTSDTVITFLKDNFYRHGLPEVIISDNGPQFRSTEFAAFLKARGIHHNRIAVYNLPAKPVERFNRVLKEELTVACIQSEPFIPAVKKILLFDRYHTSVPVSRPLSCSMVDLCACHWTV